MAKEAIKEIFRKTTDESIAADLSDLDGGRMKSVGIGLYENELAALDKIAKDNSVSRNALVRNAVRYYIKHIREGKTAVETEEVIIRKKLVVIK